MFYKFKRNIKKAFGCLFCVAFCFLVFSPSATFSAETNSDKLQQKKQELNLVQQKINALDQSIKKKDNEINSLQSEIKFLEKNINKTNLEIEKTKLIMEQMDLGIKEIQKNIIEKEAMILHEKENIKEFIKLMYENDSTSLLGMMLSGDNLSKLWADMEAIQGAQEKIQDILKNLKNQKINLEDNRIDLDRKKEEQDNLFLMQESQKRALESDKTYKNKITKSAKDKKIQMEKGFSSAQKIKEILRDEIFSLENVGVSMSMQTALDYANFAASKTGIRAEFLLGLLKVESDLGNNVGSGNYKKDMNPREHDAFLSITKKLGLNPNTTPVSKKPTKYKGWGGAMGPAQFMPTTWLGYEDDVAQLTGSSPASPWDIKDAFTAAAILLSRTGASDKTRYGEWKAAMKYLAGGNWNNPKLAWYGDRVLKIAERY